MNWILDLLKAAVGYLTPILAKYLFGLIGGFLMAWGVENPEDVVYKIVGGLLSFLLAIVIDLLQHKKVLNTEPPKGTISQ